MVISANVEGHLRIRLAFSNVDSPIAGMHPMEKGEPTERWPHSEDQSKEALSTLLPAAVLVQKQERNESALFLSYVSDASFAILTNSISPHTSLSSPLRMQERRLEMGNQAWTGLCRQEQMVSDADCPCWKFSLFAAKDVSSHCRHELFPFCIHVLSV